MKDTQRGFAVPLIVGLVAVAIGGGIYFYMRSQDKEGNLKRDLAQAQNKVATETEKLNTMQAQFEGENSLYFVIKDQYAKAREAIDYSDVFFTNPNTSKPKIKIKTTSSVQAKVEARRIEINTVLSRWKDLIALSNAENVTIESVNSILQGAETLQSFIAELSAIVDGLTPGNSGLTQSQIDAYQALVDSLTEDISDVVGNLAGAQDTENTPSTVTIEDIEEQQAVVLQAQAQVESIQQNLTQTQSQQQSQTPQAEESPSADDSTQGEDSTQLIITPGPPELIQGTNDK
jgi:hypothetical protein